MKVAHISTAQSWRGGEQQIAYLYQELDKLGVAQQILCAKGSELAKYCATNQLHFTEVRKRSSVSLAYANHIRKVAQSVDLLHAHDSHAHNNVVIAASSGVNIPVVLHRRVDFAVSNSVFSRYKYNHPSIKKIICVSNAIKAVLKPSIQQAGKLVTVHSGVDLSKPFEADGRLRKQYNIAADTLLIGNVAALAPHKDYFTFLKTAALLKHQLNAKFIMIGEGLLRTELEQEIEKLGLQNNVIITGFRNDIMHILPELDLMLVTSETEGLGTSILDAFLAKVPVVATTAGGIPEVVEDGKSGLLAAVKDAEALAAQIEKLLGDDALKRQLIEGAQKKVALFSKQNMAQSILKIYKEVLL